MKARKAWRSSFGKASSRASFWDAGERGQGDGHHPAVPVQGDRYPIRLRKTACRVRPCVSVQECIPAADGEAAHGSPKACEAGDRVAKGMGTTFPFHLMVTVVASALTNDACSVRP